MWKKEVALDVILKTSGLHTPLAGASRSPLVTNQAPSSYRGRRAIEPIDYSILFSISALCLTLGSAHGLGETNR
jgi:hypothetical protein